MSKSKASQSDPWIMTRLLRTTHARLREWGRARMASGVLDPSQRGVFGERDEPSLDAVINRLLDLDAAKRERVNKSHAKRRAERSEGQQQEGGDE